MQRSIREELKNNMHIYLCPQDATISGDANFTLGKRKRVINVYFNEHQHCSIRERFLCGAWISLFSFPPFKPEATCRYHYYENNQLSGYSTSVNSGLRLHINGDVYERRVHYGNYCSLMKNDIQVALYQRIKEQNTGSNTFLVSYDEHRISFLLVFLFGIEIDVSCYEMHLAKTHLATFPLTKKYEDRVLWRPESNQSGGE